MNINSNNLFLLIEEKRNYEVQRFLEVSGLECLDEFKRTALHNAVYYNNIELVTWLLSKGVNLNLKDINGYTPLHFAVQEAHYESAKLLLDNKALANVQDNNGNTPAMTCILNWKGGGNRKNLELLYKNNADFAIQNNYKNCPLNIIPQKIIEELKLL